MTSKIRQCRSQNRALDQHKAPSPNTSKTLPVLPDNHNQHTKMAALRRCLQSTRQPFTTRHALSTRSFTSTSIRPNDKQNMMDKDSINTDSREYSKTGGDDSTAATEDAAFNPNKTSPEEEHATASRESGGV